jgi:hypothetical protein
VSKPWANRPTWSDRIAALGFVVLGAGFAVVLVATIAVEDAARAAADRIRRTSH